MMRGGGGGHTGLFACPEIPLFSGRARLKQRSTKCQRGWGEQA